MSFNGPRRYGTVYAFQPDHMEYPGYDSSWVIGRERDASVYADDHYYSPHYSSIQYYPRSRSAYYPETHYGRSGGADLAWATEIPLRMRVSICCEGCKMKLDKALRDMHGVHDVGIAGWSNALVTVTGTAPSHKILKTARKVSKNAELWDDPYEHSTYYSHRH
ncbi:unnamed protein product [Calypogeia fissa]